MGGKSRGSLRQWNCWSAGKNGIWTFIYRTWIGMWLLSKSCQGCHRLDEQSTIRQTHEVFPSRIVNQLAKIGSECPFIESESARSISVGVSRKAIRDWMKENTGSPQWTSGIQRVSFKVPLQKRTRKLYAVNRNQLRWVTGLLLGHCHLEEHLFQIRIS